MASATYRLAFERPIHQIEERIRALDVTEPNVDNLVFDTLQAAILACVIFCAGGTLQAIEILSEYFVNRGPIFDPAFGSRLLSIVLLVILALIFWFVGRWGWAGMLIRIACAALFLWRVVQLIAFMSPA